VGICNEVFVADWLNFSAESDENREVLGKVTCSISCAVEESSLSQLLRMKLGSS
jgi:hypothetical protein